jgi:hypothetical protein
VYSITAGDERGDFEVIPNGTIVTGRTLDRERQGLYNLVVTATDGAVSPDQRLSSTVQVSNDQKLGLELVSKMSSVLLLNYDDCFQKRGMPR